MFVSSLIHEPKMQRDKIVGFIQQKDSSSHLNVTLYQKINLCEENEDT